MPFTIKLRQFCVVLATAAFTLAGSAAFAQSGGNNAKSSETPKTTTDAVKEGQKKIDEIAEASKLLSGPAGNPECVRLGTNVVSRLWNDDLDTASRHFDFYDRFTCPSAHIQAAYRCVLRQGNLDAKNQEKLNTRVRDCWLNPGLPPTEPVAAAAPPPTSDGTSTK
jgi:hypothetical protein